MIGTLDVGGTERMLASVVKNLDRQRFDITVLCLTSGGKIADSLKDDGFRVEVLGVKGKLDLSAIFKLKDFLRRGKFDIIQSYLFYSNVLARVCGRLAGTKVILSGERSTSEWKGGFYRLIDRFTAGYARMIIANSQAVKASLVEDVGIKADKIKVIVNGIDPGRFNSNVDIVDMKRQLGLSKDKMVVGTVTRLHPEKNPEVFIDAASIVKKEHDNIQFVVVGDGRLMNALKQQVARLGLSSDVIFTGERDDVAQILKVMDIFVLTSLWEGLSVSILEAMASAVPVVATDVGGTKEVVDNGVTGVLIPRKNPTETANAISMLLSKPDKLRQMGSRGKEHVEKYFTLNDMIKKIEDLYESLAESRKSD